MFSIIFYVAKHEEISRKNRFGYDIRTLDMYICME